MIMLTLYQTGRESSDDYEYVGLYPKVRESLSPLYITANESSGKSALGQQFLQSWRRGNGPEGSEREGCTGARVGSYIRCWRAAGGDLGEGFAGELRLEWYGGRG